MEICITQKTKSTEKSMLVERNENQKVELKERERIGVRGNRDTERTAGEWGDRSKKTNKNTRQRRQIRIPEHTRKIRVGGNKHKELWLEFIQFIQLSPANFILKVGSFTKLFAWGKTRIREGFFGIEGTQGIFLLKWTWLSWKEQLLQKLTLHATV